MNRAFTVFLLSIAAISATAQLRVVFDTDLGNDIDDLLALERLLNYQKAGKIEIAAITLSKDNPMSATLADLYTGARGVTVPVGAVCDGPNKDDGNYLRATLEAIGFPEDDLVYPDATDLLAETLSRSEDKSVRLIATGPLTNMARLLRKDSALVASKVADLTVMGGDFSQSQSPEWNVLQDIESAKEVFSSWPTPVVAAGFEVGKDICYPASQIMKFPADDPLRVGYEHFIPMPYDRPSWDLTAVIAAVEGDDFFNFSGSGNIFIDCDGRSVFIPEAEGTRKYLILKSADELLQRIIEL